MSDPDGPAALPITPPDATFGRTSYLFIPTMRMIRGVARRIRDKLQALREIVTMAISPKKEWGNNDPGYMEDYGVSLADEIDQIHDNGNSEDEIVERTLARFMQTTLFLLETEVPAWGRQILSLRFLERLKTLGFKEDSAIFVAEKLRKHILPQIDYEGIYQLLERVVRDIYSFVANEGIENTEKLSAKLDDAGLQVLSSLKANHVPHYQRREIVDYCQRHLVSGKQRHQFGELIYAAIKRHVLMSNYQYRHDK